MQGQTVYYSISDSLKSWRKSLKKFNSSFFVSKLTFSPSTFCLSLLQEWNMTEDSQRNFRSVYYEKVGFRGVEEKKSLEILLKDDRLGEFYELN